MKYWANINGVQHGPVEKEELLGLGLTRDSFVWREGLGDWVMVQNFSELDDLFPATPTEAEESEIDDTTPTDEQEPVIPPIPQQPPVVPQQPFVPQTPIAQQQPPAVPQVPVSQPQQQQCAGNQVCPPTNMVWAILTTVLCCQIFGIIAIVYAAQVGAKFRAGDLEGAKRYSDRAAIWCIAGIVAGLITVPFLIIAQMFSVF